MSPDDFVAAAGASSAYEMSAARVALIESHSPQVRTYAQQMIRDHTAMSAALADAATHAGLKPPSGIVGGELSPLLAALQGDRGADFDKAYARQQVVAHSGALTTERRYAREGSSVDLRGVAASDVPMIQRHLQAATALRAATGG